MIKTYKEDECYSAYNIYCHYLFSFYVLFSKAKDLTDEEKKTIINVINAIKKYIDKDLDK